MKYEKPQCLFISHTNVKINSVCTYCLQSWKESETVMKLSIQIFFFRHFLFFSILYTGNRCSSPAMWLKIISFRITMCASIFLLIASAVERYLAICRPHHYREVTFFLLEASLVELILTASNQDLRFKIQPHNGDDGQYKQQIQKLFTVPHFQQVEDKLMAGYELLDEIGFYRLPF